MKPFFRLLLVLPFIVIFFIALPPLAHAAVGLSPTDDQNGNGILEKGEVITFTATGCPVGSGVEFSWDYENSALSPNRTQRVTVEADGTATYKTSFDGTMAYIQATCYVNGAAGDSSGNMQIILIDNGGSSSGTPGSFIKYPPTTAPPKPACFQAETSGPAAGKCNKVDTAIGKLCTEANCFIQSIFALLLSLSGGLAVLIIIYAGYLYMTSRGNPEQIQKGREMIISAIVGLLFIIFSFVIMEAITTDILKLPSFL
jgi:hypothetical protein